MAPSRALLATAALLATSAMACDALLGLGAFSDVDGSSDSGQADAEDASDAPVDMTSPDVSSFPDGPDGGGADDAGDASDADAGDTPPIFDAPFDGLPATAYWARWLMPNPDAAIAPGADAMLPNPMSYTGGGDASATAVDNVTTLEWSTQPVPASTYDAATTACQMMGSGWHVPTRIELVSVVDFTQIPTIDDTTFPGTPLGTYWTASIVPVDAAMPVYWIVDFSTGLTQQKPSATYVRCVKGGT